MYIYIYGYGPFTVSLWPVVLVDNVTNDIHHQSDERHRDHDDDCDNGNSNNNNYYKYFYCHGHLHSYEYGAYCNDSSI